MKRKIIEFKKYQIWFSFFNITNILNYKYLSIYSLQIWKKEKDLNTLTILRNYSLNFDFCCIKLKTANKTYTYTLNKTKSSILKTF
jgi:hypothetical protein